MRTIEQAALQGFGNPLLTRAGWPEMTRIIDKPSLHACLI
jgi:hypothetical protein